MLVIEHDMPLIMSISDRVYCLDVGKLIAEGTPDEIRTSPAVQAAYFGAPVDRRSSGDGTGDGNGEVDA
jgi:ABC-type branched-subunit amino acid transport system ATPase component